MAVLHGLDPSPKTSPKKKRERGREEPERTFAGAFCPGPSWSVSVVVLSLSAMKGEELLRVMRTDVTREVTNQIILDGIEMGTISTNEWKKREKKERSRFLLLMYKITGHLSTKLLNEKTTHPSAPSAY